MKNWKSPPTIKTHYFSLDYGRAKEFYFELFYSEQPKNLTEFQQIIHQAIRTCLADKIHKGNIYNSDFQLINELSNCLDEVGLKAVNVPEVIWDKTDIYVAETKDFNHQYFQMFGTENPKLNMFNLSDFIDLYQDSYTRVLVKYSGSIHEIIFELNGVLKATRSLDFSDFLNAVSLDRIENVPFHSMVFGCAHSISNHWLQLLGFEVYNLLPIKNTPDEPFPVSNPF